ncbi:MAG: hypothetical protein ACTJHU_04020 [Mycetocola sp.]
MAAFATAALVGGLLTVPLAPAVAADTAPSSATLVWGFNGYAQQGVFGPWTYSGLSGNTEYLPGSTQTEYTPAPQPATSFPVNARSGAAPNAIKFFGGEGTVDPETGATTLNWEGSYTLNAYPANLGAPDESYADPELVVAADGSGTLTMDVIIGAGTSMEGEPVPAAPLGRQTLATFSEGSLVSDDLTSGYTLTPDYAGVEIFPTPGASDDESNSTPQDRTCTAEGAGAWGSWPTDFVRAMPEAVRAHFYSTGCGGMNDAKAALPVQVEYSTAELDWGPLKVTPGRDGASTINGGVILERRETVVFRVPALPFAGATESGPRFNPGESVTLKFGDVVVSPEGAVADAQGVYRQSWTVPDDFPLAEKAYPVTVVGQNAERAGTTKLVFGPIVGGMYSVIETTPKLVPSVTPGSTVVDGATVGIDISFVEPNTTIEFSDHFTDSYQPIGSVTTNSEGKAHFDWTTQKYDDETTQFRSLSARIGDGDWRSVVTIVGASGAVPPTFEITKVTVPEGEAGQTSAIVELQLVDAGGDTDFHFFAEVQEQIDGEWVRANYAEFPSQWEFETELTKLKPGTEYRVRVDPGNGAGFSPSIFSEPFTTNAATPEPPTKPETTPELATDELFAGGAGELDITVSEDASSAVVRAGQEQAGRWVGVSVHSDPVFIDWFEADDEGTVTVPLPELTEGEHHLVAYDSEGGVLGYRAFTVADDADDEAEADADSDGAAEAGSGADAGTEAEGSVDSEGSADSESAADSEGAAEVGTDADADADADGTDEAEGSAGAEAQPGEEGSAADADATGSTDSDATDSSNSASATATPAASGSGSEGGLARTGGEFAPLGAAALALMLLAVGALALARRRGRLGVESS